MRSTIKINDNWKFFLGDDPSFSCPDLDDSGWRSLRLPHDWSADFAPDKDSMSGGGGGYAVAGIGWYRKTFTADLSRRCYIQFDGIYMDATVYCNGKEAARQGYGYSSFQADVTDLLQEGENVLAVRVNNSRLPNSRWYTGSGIYRNVWLIQTENVHHAAWGLRCCTNMIYETMDEATLLIRTMLTNDSNITADTGVVHKIYNKEGEMVCITGTALQLAPGETADCSVRPSVPHPHLWTDKDPYLYTMVSTVICNEVPMDEITTQIGIRTAAFDCNKGFLLNGKSVKIKGMCLHHDSGLTGSASYEEIWRRRLMTLKEMGCNGIRTAHNPPDPMLLDLCDELGFLVMDEFCDEWTLAKNKNHNYYSQSFAYGSSQYFDLHAEEDLTRMLRRDFNHPSVILWSIGNEIPEQSSIDGVKILNFLQDICHREDPSRMVTSACDNIYAVENIRTLREFENALDVVGYNYVGRWRDRAETFYEQDKLAYPQRRMVGAENGSAGGIRGVYDKPSFFGTYATATLRHEALWRYTISRDFVAGDYLWTGIDYLGESFWPSKGASCAPIDTAGFKKDTYYYFRSIWNTEETTLHLLPHWNWEGQEGEFKQVLCYTNCDEVKLYINGRLVGTRGYVCPNFGATKAWNDPHKGHPTTNDLHLSWDVPFEPGELKAVGYKDDQEVAVAIVRTTGAPETLIAKADKETVSVGELVQIELSTLDAKGLHVPDAVPMVSCSVEGPAHLLGMDGGDHLDHTLWASPKRKMFSGLLLAIVQADEPGVVTLRFEAEGIGESTVSFTVK